MKSRFIRAFWLTIALGTPLIPISMYFAENWYSLFHSYSLGIVFGITGFVFLLNALILSTRIRYFDGLFGHNNVLIFHAFLALGGVFCIGLHFFFKHEFISADNWQTNIGITSFILFLLVTFITTLFMINLYDLSLIKRIQKRFRPDYSFLKLFHNITSLAILIAGVHVLFASSTQESFSRIAFFALYLFTAMLFYIHHKVIRQVINLNRKLKISRIENLNDNTIEIQIKGKIREHKPGQFAYFRMLSNECGYWEHPFTISSCPDKNTLLLTVKKVGNYTRKLSKIPVGTPVIMDGPYGLFTPEQSDKPLIFISGGIGITPFLSIIRQWDKDGFSSDVHLFWSTRTAQEMHPYRKQLETVAEKHTRFSFYPVISGNNSEHINTDMLKTNTGASWKQKPQIYICGPSGMLKELPAELIHSGVSRRSIITEKFSL